MMYYDDPLIAAYMAREFDVKYQAGYMGIEGADVDVMCGELEVTHEGVELHLGLFGLDTELGCMPGDRVYIHPDSVDVFKPMARDVVQDAEGVVIRFIRVSDGCEVSGLKTIQRDGKNFFMPKEEE